MGSSRQLDAKDFKILELLQNEGRISFTDLGRKIGLSQPSVSERVARLEAEGIITGYRAQIDPGKLGLKLSAIIRLRSSHEFIARCLEYFAQQPNIVNVYRVTGEDCFILEVVFSDPEYLEGLVDEIARFGSVTTSLVLRKEKPKAIGNELLSQSQ